MPTKVKNVLIYRLGSLGDTVIALPCFHQIKRAFPESKMTLLTNKPVASKAAPLQAILGEGHFFDDTITYPVGTRSPGVLLKLMREIRKRKIDTVVNITALRSPKADQRDKLFFQLCGVSEFHGFDQHPTDFNLSIDPETGAFEWEAKRLARKIETLGYIDLYDDLNWDLMLTKAELNNAHEALGSLQGQPFVGMSLGTKLVVKDWGIDNWNRLIELIPAEIKKMPLVMVGAPDEFDSAQLVIDHWGTGENLCGKTTPRESAQVLKQAAFYMGHDSGPIHLAAAVGTPCVGVYSCINRPKQWYPKGDRNSIIFPDTECAKNDIKGCVHAEENRCILSIQPEEVLENVLKIAAAISK